MDNRTHVRAGLETGQWLLILLGIVVVVIPWWLGLLWILGVVR